MPRALVVLVCLGALVSAACAQGEVAPLPKPPKPPNTSSSLPPVDLSGVPLPTVRGATTTTVPPVVGGRATLSGTVVGPDGAAVPGAVVHVERLVSEAVGVLEVTTGADGRWAMQGIFGGRYRLRAWKPAPDNLAATRAEVFFLGGSEERGFNIRLQRFQGLSVASDIAPRPPIVGERSALVVQLTELSVDAQGIVRSVPVPGMTVELFGPGQWSVLSPNPVVSAGDGRVRFEVRCGEAGDQPLSVVLGDGRSFPVDTPACVPFREEETTTTTSPGDGTGGDSGGEDTTTTTRRGGRPTTSTTEAD